MRRLAALLCLLTGSAAAEGLELRPPPEIPPGLEAGVAKPLQERRETLLKTRESLLEGARRLDVLGRDIPEDDTARIEECLKLKAMLEEGIPAYLRELGCLEGEIAFLNLTEESLRMVVPPPPSEAVRHLARIINGETILDAPEHHLFLCDLALSGAEVAGQASPVAKCILIAGKTIIAGEDGALACATRKDKTYKKALDLLKNTEKAKPFVDLIRKLRAGEPLPQDADPELVEAARAITDPTLGGTSTEIVLSNLFSVEAAKAAFGQFAWEVAGTLLSAKVESRFAEEMEKRSSQFAQAMKLQRRAKKTADALDRAYWETGLKRGKPKVIVRTELIMANALPHLEEGVSKAVGEGSELLADYLAKRLHEREPNPTPP